MEVLLSRYILEILKDPKLLKLYNNDLWYPDIESYHLFFHKQEKNNENFAKLLKKFHMIKKDDHIIETVSSLELQSVSAYLEKEATIIQSGYGTIKCSSTIPQIMEYPSCYISNGIYHDTEKIILKLLGNGSFIVGVCDNPNSVFYQRNLEKIEELEKKLRKIHVGYRVYTHTNHRDKAVLLYHRR